MRHVLVALQAHGDLTKIEFEDGILRRIIPARLDIESSLFGIDADLRAEQQTELGAHADEGPSAVLTFSSLDESGPSADGIAEMVIDVAMPTAIYVTDSTTIGENTDTWIGRATPGSKLIVFLARAAGIDEAEFDEWLDNASESLSQTAGPGRVVVHRIVDNVLASPDHAAIVTVRFPAAQDRDSAIESGLAELAGDAVDANGTRRLLTFEHRFHADPNHWGAGRPSPPSVA